jgi:hypothetical protein
MISRNKNVVVSSNSKRRLHYTEGSFTYPFPTLNSSRITQINIESLNFNFGSFDVVEGKNKLKTFTQKEDGARCIVEGVVPVGKYTCTDLVECITNVLTSMKCKGCLFYYDNTINRFVIKFDRTLYLNANDIEERESVPYASGNFAPCVCDSTCTFDSMNVRINFLFDEECLDVIGFDKGCYTLKDTLQTTSFSTHRSENQQIQQSRFAYSPSPVYCLTPSFESFHCESNKIVSRKILVERPEIIFVNFTGISDFCYKDGKTASFYAKQTSKGYKPRSQTFITDLILPYNLEFSFYDENFEPIDMKYTDFYMILNVRLTKDD